MKIHLDVLTPFAIVYYVEYNNHGRKIYNKRLNKIVEILNHEMCSGYIRVVKYTYYEKRMTEN